jgi:hypothetical protein
MTRIDRALALATIAAVGLVTSAWSDSRIFSVRTDAPGLNIASVTRNGKSLPKAGQSGDTAFFRIDVAGGTVLCTNTLTFVATDGQQFEADVDLCEQNWDLTLEIAGDPGGAPGPSTPGPFVTIRTDDPTVSIQEVYFAGKPVPIAKRVGDAVQVRVTPGSPGFTCKRDLGLILSDGRGIAREADICVNGGDVLVVLVGGAAPPQVPGPTPAPGGIEVVDGFEWMFAANANRATLSYAIPNSDGAEFWATCKPQSSSVTVNLGRSGTEVEPGAKFKVALSAGSFSKSYTATGSKVSELTGESQPVLQLKTADPLWPALIKEKILTVRIGSDPPFGLSLKGSGVKTKQFLSACDPPPVIVEPGPEPGFGPEPGTALAVNYNCDDGIFITIAFDDSSGTAVVSETGWPPVVLFRAPSPVGARYVAGTSELIGEDEQLSWSRDGSFPLVCEPN